MAAIINTFLPSVRGTFSALPRTRFRWQLNPGGTETWPEEEAITQLLTPTLNGCDTPPFPHEASPRLVRTWSRPLRLLVESELLIHMARS